MSGWWSRRTQRTALSFLLAGFVIVTGSLPEPVLRGIVNTPAATIASLPVIESVLDTVVPAESRTSFSSAVLGPFFADLQPSIAAADPISTSYQVYAYGVNWDGNLGDGTTTHRYIPVGVRGITSTDYLSNVVQVAAGRWTPPGAASEQRNRDRAIQL